MMKRLIALLMALAMVLGLTACAKEEATAEDLQVASYRGTVLTNSQLQYWFWDAYYEFLDVYGYGYYFDPAQPLNEQLLTETNTWEDYFLSSCINQWVTIQMLYGEAVKAGHQMPAELQAELDTLEQSVTDYALNTLGESDMNKYFEDYYGKGANMADFKAYTELLYYANSFGEVKYMEYLDKVTKEATDPVHMVNVRHLLVCPTDATLDVCWSDAKRRAEELLEEWKRSPTESNFASLATLYTEDPGSQETGGLYEDIYPGQMVEPFEEWCFAEGRQIGDTGIVETSYGYHLMYFSGWGDVYAGALEDEAVEQYYAWLDTVLVADELSVDMEAVEIQLIAVQRGEA